MSQEVGSGGANFGFGGGKFKAVFAQAFEKGADVGGVVGRGGVEDDDVVEVCGDAFQAFDDLVDDLHEPAGGGAAALRHDKPLEEPVGCAERRQWDGVLVNGNLVEGGDQVENGENAAFAQGVQDLVDAGDGKLSEGADGVQLLVVDGDPDASILLGDGDHGAGVGRSGMLDQAGGQVLVKDGVRLFGEYGVYPVWTGGDRGAARGYGNLEGDKGAGTEVCLRCGEDVLELAEDVAQVVDHRW